MSKPECPLCHSEEQSACPALDIIPLAHDVLMRTRSGSVEMEQAFIREAVKLIELEAARGVSGTTFAISAFGVQVRVHPDWVSGVFVPALERRGYNVKFRDTHTNNPFLDISWREDK